MYWRENYSNQAGNISFVNGIIAGLTAFAWWKDGVQEVGTTGKTLKTAIKEVREQLEVKADDSD